MKNHLSTMLLLLGVTLGLQAQNVYIPDPAFKTALLGNAILNTNGDTEIQVTEAQAYRGGIDVHGKGIATLTGIEYFTGLTHLYCHNNQIDSLDLSNNNAVTSLIAFDNQLVYINLSNLTALTQLMCHNNQLSSLDVNTNTALLDIQCANNQITRLDFVNNDSIKYLYCQNNQLTSLNVRNGHNRKMVRFGFSAMNNPSLGCIEVDDVTYSDTTWHLIGTNSYFSTSCNITSSTSVVPSKTWRVYPNPSLEGIYIDLGNVASTIQLTLTNVTGQQILNKSYTQQQFISLDWEGPAGVYVLQIATEEGQQTLKIVRE